MAKKIAKRIVGAGVPPAARVVTNPKGRPSFAEGTVEKVVRIVVSSQGGYENIVQYLSASQRGEILLRAATIVRDATAKVSPDLERALRFEAERRVRAGDGGE